jgi:hypothetical protein
MRLPSAGFSDTKESQVWSPKDYLSREVACPECGRAATYTAKDVRWGNVGPETSAPGSGLCWCIEAGCNESLCDLPIEFHLLTDAQKGTEEIRFLMLRLFERGFFQNLVCGRGHAPGKNKIRAVRRVA